jgi:hypothetical protein
MFSSTLMLSSFKGIEARRETAMRNIEDSSKQVGGVQVAKQAVTRARSKLDLNFLVL